MAELALPAHVDIDAAELIKKAVAQALEAGEPLTLEAEEVASISCAGVQMVIAANRRLLAAEAKLVVSTPSVTFIEAFEGLGFDEELKKVAIEQ